MRPILCRCMKGACANFSPFSLQRTLGYKNGAHFLGTWIYLTASEVIAWFSNVQNCLQPLRFSPWQNQASGVIPVWFFWHTCIFVFPWFSLLLASWRQKRLNTNLIWTRKDFQTNSKYNAFVLPVETAVTLSSASSKKNIIGQIMIWCMLPS